MHRGTAWVVLGFGLLLMAGPVAAQDTDTRGVHKLVLMANQIEGEPVIAPLGPLGQDSVHVHLACQLGTGKRSPDTTSTAIEMALTSSVEGVQGVLEHSIEQVEVRPGACTEEWRYEFMVQASVAASPAVAAGTAVTLSLDLSSQDDAFEAAQITWTREVGYGGQWDATPVQAIHQAGEGETLAVAVRLENAGNGPILVDARLSEDHDTMLDMQLPVQVQVPAAVGDAPGTVVAEVLITTPSEAGYVDRRDMVLLDWVAIPVGYDDPLPPQQTTFMVQTQSASIGESPALPLPIIVVIGLALAYWVRGARRQT